MANIRQVDLHLFAAFVLECLLAEQVDVSHGAIVQAGRHNTGADRRAELDFQLFQNLEVVRIFKVRFGHEHHAGLVVFQCQFIGLFCADGNAGTARNTDQDTFRSGDALGSAGFKIKQAGNINQVELGAVTFHGNHAGIQRCFAACFFGVKIAGGGAVLNTAHALSCTAQIQQGFGQSRFTAACVAGHKNVANVLTGVFHCLTNLFSRRDKLSPPGICIYCDVVCSTFGMFLLYHTFCLK